MPQQTEPSFPTGHQPSPLHTTKQSQSGNIPQTRHITHSSTPDQRPVNQSTSYFLAHELICHFHTHTTITHPTSRLPGPQIWADLNNPTINRILPPVIPTHNPHDIQHAIINPYYTQYIILT